MENESLLGGVRSSYKWNNLFRKPLLANIGGGHGDDDSGSLKRSLGAWDLITYGISSTIGAGIFVTIGIVAHEKAGPGIVLSFIFAGIASLLSAFCYSEFASRFPVSGSAYSFASVSLGEAVGWFVGWNLTLEYAISASAVARGWAEYLVDTLTLCGVHVPEWLKGIPLNSFFSFSPLAGLICILCTAFLLIGMKESARFNMVMTVLNISIILFIIIAGSLYVKPANWDPFLPFGIDGAWSGVGTVFFSYIGFDSVSTLAGEVANPKKDLPIGIVGTLGIVSTLYIAVSLVITGMVRYDALSESAPLSAAFATVGNNWASTIVAVGSVTVMTASTLCSLVGQPRIFLQMSKDGLFFSIFSRVNPKSGAPVQGTLITGLVSTLIALFFQLDSLVNMISIGTLLAFIVVCAGVVILRYQTPEKPKKAPVLILAYAFACLVMACAERFITGPYHLTWLVFVAPVLVIFVVILLMPQANVPDTFRCPLVPFIPCLGILMNLWFIVHLPLDSIYRLLIWTFIGFAIYFFYGIRYSRNVHDEYNKSVEDSVLN